MLLIILLGGLLLALAGPLLHRLREGLVLWAFTLFTAATFAWLVGVTGAVGSGHILTASIPWVPALGVELAFFLDGLSLLFALLTTGIGVLVLLYSSAYLHGNRYRDRFFGYVFLFMISMLGILFAADLISLVVFWEMTTFTSYLLIGFEHEHETSRRWALQALLVTGAGGLALLAGVLLLGGIAGTRDLMELLAHGEAVRSHPLYVPTLLLILLGAFTKSAHFPFHFWLPSAMIAPTPVSAYLHSAAMVQAGVYLLARLLPVLGGTDVWLWAVGLGGGVTMLAGAFLSVCQQELKYLLAYATITALGIMTLMLGLGTATAVKAMVVFLLVHALYKSALFMVAGAVGKGAGTREIPRLGGLWRFMPGTAFTGVLAALAMAGLPPVLGYMAKSLLYRAEFHAETAPPWLPAAGALGNGLLVTAAAVFAIGVFFGRRKTEGTPKRISFFLVGAPFPLAVAGVVLGLFPDLVDTPLLTPAAAAVHALEKPIELKLWHGVNPVFLVGAGSILFGLAAYAVRETVPWQRLGRFPAWGPERLFHLSLNLTERFAAFFARYTQAARLRSHLAVAIGAAVVLAGLGLAAATGVEFLGGK